MWLFEGAMEPIFYFGFTVCHTGEQSMNELSNLFGEKL